MTRTTVFLLALGVLLVSQVGWGFDFGLGLGMEAPLRQRTTLSLSEMIQPKADLANDATAAGMLRTHLAAYVPVYREEQDAVALSARSNWMNPYPNTPEFPDLYDIQMGASYTHQIEEKKLWSVSGSFGSASDHPFKDSSVDTVGATALYSFPGSESGTWLLLLNYSNNRPFLNNVPLPGFAYTYAPSKTFQGTFGVPFASIYWEFVDRWSLTLFTVAPWIAQAQIAYAIQGPLQLFSGVDFSQATYLQYGRANSKERLFYDEKKAFVGAKSPLSRIFFFEVEAGYSFGRQLFSAESYSPHPANATELGATAYGKTGVVAIFP